MSSFSENIGHIHFPHRLRRSQDIHIILQPTASRGGLTFTEALIAPTAEAHLAPLPSDQVVRKLCTEHAPVTAATILDPIDGMTCDACHSPPALNSNVLPASDGNARPYVFGQGMAPAGLDFIVPVNIDTDRLSHEGHRSEDLLAQRPTILDGDVHFPELSSPLCTDAYAVRSLSRTALRMLWHQRLGHINFRRLSEMHRFVKGMPQFQIPTELEGCPICLAAKLRKAPKGIETTMRATTCNQGLSIDFGFMVQKSRDSVRHNTLVGLNGETCYVLLTDHFSGRIFGRAFATKAPPIDWINSWLASNSPQCPDKYVRMDGGGELGKCRDIHRTFANFGYAVELTGPDSSHQNGPESVHIRRSAMLFAPCFPVRISSPTSGRMHSTTTFACITSSPRRSTYKPIRDVWCPSPKSGKATDLWMSDPRSSNDCSIRSRRSELPPRYFSRYSRP
ncbi:Reverse transcriptase (RNA-dependent DNA polymerase) [Fragilaria crotonensis]|nr:Reverse transcriptase (RNA-dependent DNA polymerase) [Fragilaria crotonensis]